VLLLGETGTGKELLAHAIHAASKRAAGPFISVNIAAVPDTLLEAEFFGFVPGAFTGADRKGRDGKFRLAHGGTLFLDEIGDMPLALQSKLLRALQEGEIEPLGSNKLIPIDVRVIAATSRDLTRLVREGGFREDLFYRLHVLPIRVPPLRERRADIAALLEALGEDVALRSGMSPPELSSDALALMEAQPWRGNIRELRNVLEQAAMRSDSPRIDVQQLQTVLRESGVQPMESMPTAASATANSDSAPDHDRPATIAADLDGGSELLRPLAEQVAELEQRAIQAALRANRGNKAAAAKMLGMARATLYARLKYG
jgi:transcriptional regulator with PAS, ATPase and Fis domain